MGQKGKSEGGGKDHLTLARDFQQVHREGRCLISNLVLSLLQWLSFLSQHNLKKYFELLPTRVPEPAPSGHSRLQVPSPAAHVLRV